MKVYLLLTLILFSFNLISQNLYELDPDKNYLDSGKKLMNLDFGLHNLEQNSKNIEILISIHGGDSRGFEWIYPLQKIDDDKMNTYFFRWDTTKCPQESVPLIMNEIKKIKGIEKITILGHSFGGVFASLLLNEINQVKTDIHVIASPLASRDLEKYCDYIHPKTKNENISYFQWRTIQKIDLAFNNLDYDPQVLDFKESSVIRLPEKYRGNRLGHLWSISWVADNIDIIN